MDLLTVQRPVPPGPRHRQQACCCPPRLQFAPGLVPLPRRARPAPPAAASDAAAGQTFTDASSILQQVRRFLRD